MDRTVADDLSRRWVDAWNQHDVESVLAHFADDTSSALSTIGADGS